MKDFRLIEEELFALEFGQQFIEKVEVKELTKLMISDEKIRALLNAEFSNNTGILVLTERNLFFISEALGDIKSGTIPLYKISNVDIEGEIMNIINFSKSKFTLKVKDTGDIFSFFIRELKKIPSIKFVSIANRTDDIFNQTPNYVGVSSFTQPEPQRTQPIKTKQPGTGGLFASLLIFGVLFFASFSTFSTEEDYKDDYLYDKPYIPEVYDPSDELEVLDYKQTSDQYFRYIEGRVQNNSNVNFIYAQVDIALYDSQGNIVGSTFDNVNNVGPGEIWYFKAMIIDGENATKYKIKDVFGY